MRTAGNAACPVRVVHHHHGTMPMQPRSLARGRRLDRALGLRQRAVGHALGGRRQPCRLARRAGGDARARAAAACPAASLAAVSLHVHGSDGSGDQSWQSCGMAVLRHGSAAGEAQAAAQDARQHTRHAQAWGARSSHLDAGHCVAVSCERVRRRFGAPNLQLQGSGGGWGGFNAYASASAAAVVASTLRHRQQAHNTGVHSPRRAPPRRRRLL
jgi:hypothetical protein